MLSKRRMAKDNCRLDLELNAKGVTIQDALRRQCICALQSTLTLLCFFLSMFCSQWPKPFCDAGEGSGRSGGESGKECRIWYWTRVSPVYLPFECQEYNTHTGGHGLQCLNRSLTSSLCCDNHLLYARCQRIALKEKASSSLVSNKLPDVFCCSVSHSSSKRLLQEYQSSNLCIEE